MRKKVLETKLLGLPSHERQREDLEIEQLADPLDQVRSGGEHDIAIQILDHRTQLIHDIRSALAKF